MNDIEIITANLPPNMHPIDRQEYIDAHIRIIEIQQSGVNLQNIEPLRNRAFNIITSYIVNQY